MLMDDVHLSTARHFRYELHFPAENFQQPFGAREVCCTSAITTGEAVQNFKMKFNATLGVSRKLTSSVSTLSMYKRGLVGQEATR